MHVMEDVEEGCNVSGALPSSPGHAEQRPDLPKDITPVATTESPKSPPVTNGLLSTDQSTEQTSTPSSPEPKEDSDKKETEKDLKITDRDEDDRKEDAQDSLQDNEDSNSNDSDNCGSKRKCEEDESPAKRLRTQVQQQYIIHDKVLNDYMESTGCNTADDIQAHSDQLIAEIRTLNELAREKEREWNNILHLKKVKEELLLRMQRKRQILLLNSDKSDCSQNDWDLSGEVQLCDILEKNKDGIKTNNSGLMMVPIVSSSPANSKTNSQSKSHSRPRSILPKPGFNPDYNNQSNECRQGRQGPILDVRSIIADYRQRHPETVPRRGRRLKSVLNSSNHGETVVTTSGKMQGGSVINMTSLGLGSGAQIRHGDVTSELGLLLSTMDAAKQQDLSRPSSADSSITNLPSDPMSFKDVLVQFARLSQSERQELQAQAAAAASLAAGQKPYPEVTLHPVPSTATATITQQNPSLLHGILTKNQTKTDPNKTTTFSPTLARLLTAPERVSNNNAQAMYNAAAAALNSGVSISDLLTTNNKSRNEITITPIGQFGQNTKKDEEHVEEEEAEDSADRLVIDESGQDNTEGRQRTDNGSETGDEVPQCQGCHQKSAQFVCAGCGNQWYCSRDCQVSAWDEHSEVCSG